MFDRDRNSLARRVADGLRTEIESDRWLRELPGIRMLCEEYRVSKQTMMVAIRHLEADGFVSGARAGKSRLVLKMGSKGSTEAHRVMIITSKSLEDLPSVDRQLTQSLKKSLDSRGHECATIVLEAIADKSGIEFLEGVFELNLAELYIVHGVHPVCRDWLDQQSRPVVYLGGYSSMTRFPSVAFSYVDRCRIALKELQFWQHQRVVLLLPEAMQGVAEELSEVEEMVSGLFESFGLAYSRFNSPRWSGGTDACYLALEKSLHLTPPTAVILSESSMVPTMMSLLIRKGLRYPEDISIICLEDDSVLSLYRPPVSYMMTSPELLVKKVLTIVDEMSGANVPGGEHGVKVALKMTGSVASPGEGEWLSP